MTRPSPDSPDGTPARVVAAAREEIINRGILGMRVAKVAARAECSITTIYLYFGSRDGLLAEVLLRLHNEMLDDQFALIRRQVLDCKKLKPDNIIEIIEKPITGSSNGRHAMRNQVLAAAASNPVLMTKLSESLDTRRVEVDQLMDEIESRLQTGFRLDRQAMRLYVFGMDWQYNTLLGDSAVTQAQLRNFMKQNLFVAA